MLFTHLGAYDSLADCVTKRIPIHQVLGRPESLHCHSWCRQGQDMEQQGISDGYGGGVGGVGGGRGISGRKHSTGENTRTQNSLVWVGSAISFLGLRNSKLGGQDRKARKPDRCRSCAHTLFPLILSRAPLKDVGTLSLQQCPFQRCTRNHRLKVPCGRPAIEDPLCPDTDTALHDRTLFILKMSMASDHKYKLICPMSGVSDCSIVCAASRHVKCKHILCVSIW